MDNDRPRGEEDEAIAPDIAPRRDLPLDPADAVERERDKYGDSSTNPNREDQEDVHRGTADDIV
jgi:hypothetical protein